MNHDGAETQSADQQPPVQIVCMTLDSTARAKAIGAVAWSNMAVQTNPPADTTQRGRAMYVTLVSDVAWYMRVAAADANVTSPTLDPAAADIATVNLPTLQANGCIPIPAGVEVNLRLDRWDHFFLIVKAQSTGGVLRAFASSNVWRNGS